MAGMTRRAALLAGGAAIGVGATRGLVARSPVLDGAGVIAPGGGESHLNDASLLSETPIHRHLVMEEAPGEALVARLRAELAEAREAGRPVNIGAARHSMGGQAIPRAGHAVTFRNGFLEPDTAAGIYRVHAGARWSEVIAALDPIGFSPKVMQSNHDFGVAATFSVNAHGWPAPLGPMGSSVRAVTMVMADGELVRASRGDNADLFRAAMGGYGLIGLITELDVEMVPNRRLDPTFEEVAGAEFGPAFGAAMEDGAVNMAYGRLNVDRARFFEDALMITYRAADDQSDLPPAATSGFISRASRHIFRAQLGNERLKRWRWWTETDLGPRVAGGAATRNSLLNEPVVTLDDRDPARTDILHEYFVPPEAFAGVPGRLPRGDPRFLPGALERHAPLGGARSRQPSDLRAGAADRGSNAFQPGDDRAGGGRHGAHDRGADRPGDRTRRGLLPALPASCTARPVHRKLPPRA